MKRSKAATDHNSLKSLTRPIEEARAEGDTTRVEELEDRFRSELSADEFKTLDFRAWCESIPERLHFSSLDLDTKYHVHHVLSSLMTLAERFSTEKAHWHFLICLLSEIIMVEIAAEREDNPARDALAQIIDTIYTLRDIRGGGDQPALERARQVFLYRQFFGEVLALAKGKKKPSRSGWETDSQYAKRCQRGWRGVVEDRIFPEKAAAIIHLVENEIGVPGRGPKHQARRGPKTPESLAIKYVADYFDVSSSTVRGDWKRYKRKFERGEIEPYPPGLNLTGWAQKRRRPTRWKNKK